MPQNVGPLDGGVELSGDNEHITARYTLVSFGICGWGEGLFSLASVWSESSSLQNRVGNGGNKANLKWSSSVKTMVGPE